MTAPPDAGADEVEAEGAVGGFEALPPPPPEPALQALRARAAIAIGANKINL
ncbi:MAG TPA: hypothetical protein PKI99_02580 [Terrimesophilobacter sp.]|nr:hypothetical protein [Terrimesophilobacter sp.]